MRFFKLKGNIIFGYHKDFISPATLLRLKVCPGTIYMQDYKILKEKTEGRVDHTIPTHKTDNFWREPTPPIPGAPSAALNAVLLVS